MKIPDLSGECTIGLKVAILRGDLDILAELLLERDEIDRRRRYNDLCINRLSHHLVVKR